MLPGQAGDTDDQLLKDRVEIRVFWRGRSDRLQIALPL
jgi:hypothetical protein